MKFGNVENADGIDFTLPADHAETKGVLDGKDNNDLKIYIGCAKWNKTDLKNFYPRGTKDELAYYSTQFNSVELNATFYRLFPAATFEKWRDAVPSGFKFFPKLGQDISHFRRLKEVSELVNANATNFSLLEEKLGVTFLQMHNNFSPKDFERVEAFAENWQFDIPLAMEFRHTDWFNNPEISAKLYSLLEKHRITNVLVDTAGRRDLLHMRLTTPTPFVRYVGANHESDYSRLDDWVERIAEWKKAGIKELYFFVHQNIEKESPLLSAYLIGKLNKKLGMNLIIPQTLPLKEQQKGTLF